jgi:signal transduction histidine kinase
VSTRHILASRRPPDTAVAADVQRLVRAYANDGEAALSAARVVICATLMFRYLWVAGPAHGDPLAVVVQHIGSLLVAMAASIWLLRGARRQSLGPAALLACTAGEAILCFFALRGTVLRPPGHYGGILRMPDVSFPVVMVFASGLRLYWPVVVAAQALNAASVALLVRSDWAHNRGRISFSWNDVQMVAIELGAASLAVLISVWAARRTLRRVAAESERVSRGRSHLREVLREHHDVRTLLSSARLQLDFLKREETLPNQQGRLAALERAVVDVGGTLERVKERTFGELALADDIAAVDAVSIIEGAVSVARDRFPDAAITTAVARSAPSVLLLGGERAFAHVVMNLLVNACEGDGTRGAKQISVRMTPPPGGTAAVTFEFVDDGPGFRPELLQSSLRGGLTTKPTGSGIGLSLVSGLVEASGGTIAADNLPTGGASVSLSLRVAGR